MQNDYKRVNLKVQGKIPSCEHQTDTLASVRDFWEGIKECQIKMNFKMVAYIKIKKEKKGPV